MWFGRNIESIRYKNRPRRSLSNSVVVILSRVQSSSFSDLFLNLFTLGFLILLSLATFSCKFGYESFSLSHLTPP